MHHDVDAPVSDPSVAELQDFYLNAESRAVIAREHLSEMAETQRKQAESIVSVIQSLRDALRSSETTRLSLEEENRRQSARIVDTERQLKIVHANYARLSESYSSMMNIVENTHTDSLGLNQRIDAMLLQNDLGLARHAAALPVRRVTEFRDGVFSQQSARPAHPDSPPPQMHHDAYYTAPHQESEFTTYGHDPYATRPLSAHRNER
jgi:predicted nucleic acid-binding protein